MKGLLLVNSFLKTAKFGDLYRFFVNACKARGIALDVRSSDALYAPVGDFDAPDCDFVLFWDKDLRLGTRLEQCGRRLFNSVRTVELCDDKALTAEVLVASGVRTPLTLIAPKTYSNVGYTDSAFLTRAEDYLSYPYVIKHRCGSFGAQVFLARSRDEAAKICKDAGGNEVILQDFISESAGRDLRVNVVGNEICGVIYRYNDADFRSNITLGGKMKPFAPDRETAELALAAARAVGADYAGVDVLFGRDGPIVCEVNASPHFKTTYECTGIDLAEKIVGHIVQTLG